MEALMGISRRSVLVSGTALGSLAFATTSHGQRARNTLVAAMPRDIRTLDGNYANLRENDILGLLVDDALFAVDPETALPVPLAAKGHRFLSPTSLEVELRDDVTFHDGSKMTVEDVVYTYKYLLTENNGNEYYSRFSRWLADCTPVDATKVLFTLKQPYAMALYDFAMYSKIRKLNVYSDATKPNGVNAEAQTLSLNGSGPYRVVSFRPGQQIVLQRYDGYRRGGPKGTPAIRNITIRIIPDWSTQAAEVISGGVHWTFGMPAEIAEGAAATRQASLVAGPSMRVFYVSLDATGRTPGAEPLKDVRVRRAMNHAIDRDGITRNLIKGAARVLHTPCDTVQFGCDGAAATVYGFDPARARALLAEAGYGGGFDIEFWAAQNRPIVEAMVAQWRAVGIRVTLRYVQGATLTHARREQRIALEFASSGSFGIPDAGAIMPDRLGPGSGRNYSGDEDMARTVLAAVSTYDADQRKAAFSAAIRRITDQAYWVPLWTDGQMFLVSNDLVYTQPGDGMQRLYTARWR
jgi:peptide/nickel transport system substrate-binding protein